MGLFQRYTACFVGSFVAHVAYFAYNEMLNSQLLIENPILVLLSSWLAIGYTLTFATDFYSKKDGELSRSFQRLPFWRTLMTNFLDSSDYGVECEEKLDDNKQYIFGSFPHGANTIQHMLSMTDCCGFFKKVYDGPRRDLCASILFSIPVLRELITLLGNVDASSKTCHYNLRKGRSLLIFVGGEKEQLMTKENEHKVYLKNRKGFVKLALTYGTDLVPMYAFGENELYHISDWGLGFRKRMQERFSIAWCITTGAPRWWNPLAPLRGSTLHVVVGKPIPVPNPPKNKEDITQEDVDSMHDTFCGELNRLFEAHKGKYGVDKEAKLQII